MHPADIKAAIAKKGGSLVEVDKLYGLPEKSCSDALRMGRPSAELAIAEFLGVAPSKLWPDRYFKNGLRKNARDKRPVKFPQKVNRKQTHSASPKFTEGNTA